MNSHKGPTYVRGDIHDSHAGPEQVNFRYDPLLELLHMELCSAAQDSCSKHLWLGIITSAEIFFDFETFSIFYSRCLFPELLLLLFKVPSKPDDICGISGKLSISDDWEP